MYLFCVKLLTLFKKSYTPLQSVEKIKFFCSYQERCHFEVQQKLFSYGLNKKEIEEIICQLIEEDYLNEQRFAIEFVRGRFRQKQWGKVKIKCELKLKKVSEYITQKALQTIEEKDYLNTLAKLTQQKWKELKQEQYINRQLKTTKFLLQKGFETDLIKKEIAKIRTTI